MDISTSRAEPHMIAKAEDFEFAFQSVIRNCAILDRLLTVADTDYLAGGEVVAVSGTMTFTVDELWANGRDADLPAYLGGMSPPVTVYVPQNFPRIDIVQVRGVLEGFDRQQRSFFDPETGRAHYFSIDTKNRLSAEVTVRRGIEGASHAPETDTGYIKIAEIHVDPETFSLTQDNIKNVTAVSQGGENEGWTNERARTFRPAAGGLTDLSERINAEVEARKRGDADILAAIAAIRGWIAIQTIKGPETVFPLDELGITYSLGKQYAVFVSAHGNYPEFLPFGAEVKSGNVHIYAQRLVGGQAVPGTRVKKWGEGKWGEGRWGEHNPMQVNILIREL